jgi:hypothetical protein
MYKKNQCSRVLAKAEDVEHHQDDNPTAYALGRKRALSILKYQLTYDTHFSSLREQTCLFIETRELFTLPSLLFCP